MRKNENVIGVIPLFVSNRDYMTMTSERESEVTKTWTYHTMDKTKSIPLSGYLFPVMISPWFLNEKINIE